VKRIRVKYKQLGKHKVWGFSDSAGFVELDSKLKGKKHLEILIHECMHLIMPEDTEEEIVRKSVLLTNTLWFEKYRRVDNAEGIPLQDGTL
jgi:hypothetical protein